MTSPDPLHGVAHHRRRPARLLGTDEVDALVAQRDKDRVGNVQDDEEEDNDDAHRDH